MPNQKDRIILDTNIWISFLISRKFTKLDELIVNNKSTLIFSNELIEEFIEVTQRGKLKKYFSHDEIENLLLKINEFAEIINVVSNVVACRDAKDDFLLSLAIDGKATHLITGDKDLLVLKAYENTRILTISEYLSDTEKSV